jgi:hypothetical protein
MLFVGCSTLIGDKRPISSARLDSSKERFNRVNSFDKSVILNSKKKKVENFMVLKLFNFIFISYNFVFTQPKLRFKWKIKTNYTKKW